MEWKYHMGISRGVILHKAGLDQTPEGRILEKDIVIAKFFSNSFFNDSSNIYKVPTTKVSRDNAERNVT
jgi:hypothetical protein